MLSYENYEPQSEWGKRIYAEGRVAGEAAGRRMGDAEGRRVGEAAGRRAGEIKALRVLLEARGLCVGPEYQVGIESCLDLTQIDTWLRRAAVVTSIDEVFA